MFAVSHGFSHLLEVLYGTDKVLIQQAGLDVITLHDLYIILSQGMYPSLLRWLEAPKNTGILLPMLAEIVCIVLAILR